MHFKLSARELEILEDRETILKRLADNQVRIRARGQGQPTDLMKDNFQCGLLSNCQNDLGG